MSLAAADVERTFLARRVGIWAALGFCITLATIRSLSSVSKSMHRHETHLRNANVLATELITEPTLDDMKLANLANKHDEKVNDEMKRELTHSPLQHASITQGVFSSHFPGSGAWIPNSLHGTMVALFGLVSESC